MKAQILTHWLTPPAMAPEVRRVAVDLQELTIQVAPEYKSDVHLAARPVADFAYGLAKALISGDTAGKRVELGRCWLWVAANAGSADAAADLSRALLAEGVERKPRVPATDLMRMAADWLDKSVRLGDDAKSKASDKPALRRPAFVPSDPEPDEVEEMIDDDTPGVVVAPTLGDPNSRDGELLARRYSTFIGRKLPYKGKLENPAALVDEFQKEFPWAGHFAKFLLGQLSSRWAAGLAPKLPAFLLVGPSGCGKTTMLEWLAQRCEFPYVTIAVGGTNDSAGIAAVGRGWLNSIPSAPVQVMNDTRCCNPAIILDELDKGVSDMTNRNGSIAGALLSILQAPSAGFRDSCLMANVDVSNISFMASANSLLLLPEALRQRFVIHAVPAPGPEHFDAILPGIVARKARELGMTVEQMPYLTPADKGWLRKVFETGKGSIRPLTQAYSILIGELASEEAIEYREAQAAGRLN